MKDINIRTTCDICRSPDFVINNISIPYKLLQVGGVDPNEMYKREMTYKEFDICIKCLEKLFYSISKETNMSNFFKEIPSWKIVNKWVTFCEKNDINSEIIKNYK